MLLLPEGCLVRLLLPLLFLLRELDEADVEADLNSSDNTTVIEGQLKERGNIFIFGRKLKLDYEWTISIISDVKSYILNEQFRRMIKSYFWVNNLDV